MAVKILNVTVTPTNYDTSWTGIKNNYSSWEEVSELNGWSQVERSGLTYPLEVTVGESITVTVTAVDITWDYIKEHSTDWNGVKNDYANWNSILNYH